MLHLTVAQGLWLFLPAYLSNMLATLVGGGQPIDGGRVLKDGQRLFGAGKTWRGIIIAPILAVAATGILHWLAPKPGWGLDDFSPWWPVHGYALALGALVGDMTKSFFKRRRGRPSGSRWLGPDQYDFVVGALLFGLVASVATAPFLGANWFLDAFTLGPLLVILILTPGLHLLVNGIGYIIGAKEVPW